MDTQWKLTSTIKLPRWEPLPERLKVGNFVSVALDNAILRQGFIHEVKIRNSWLHKFITITVCDKEPVKLSNCGCYIYNINDMAHPIAALDDVTLCED